MKYEVIKNFRDNEVLRHSFNELAKEVHDIDFEDWYQNGYWGDNYNPYGIMEDGKIVAIVSVNQMDFVWNGERKHLIQLGTVMTKPAYRNRGMIRAIMEQIDQDLAGNYDGMFLYANDTVTDFYPKFGFTVSQEYYCEKEVTVKQGRTIQPVPMKNKNDFDVVEEAINRAVTMSQFEMVGNSALIMFYLTKYMQGNVFFDPSQNAYVIGELEKGVLTLDGVYADHETDLERIIQGFGSEVKKVLLHFTPKITEGYTMLPVSQDNSHFFVRGTMFSEFEKQKLRIQELAHA